MAVSTPSLLTSGRVPTSGTAEHGTGTVTTASVASTTGDLLVLLVTALSGTGGGALNTFSASGHGTWTNRGQTTVGTDFRKQGAVLTCPVTSGTTATVVITCTSQKYNVEYTLFRVTGHDTTTPVAGYIGSAVTTPLNGAHSITLAATPTADDMCIGWLAFDADPGITSVASPGSSGRTWTELSEVTNGTDYASHQSQYSTGSTNTTVSWADVNSSAGTYYSAFYGGIIIKAAAVSGMTGTGTPSLARATVAGTGTQTHSGSGTPALARSTMAGTGTQTLSGTGTPTLAAVTMAGTGTQTHSAAAGTGAPTLAAVTMAGTGTVAIIGTGSPTLAAVAIAGTGAQPFTATGSPTLAAVTMAGTGVHGSGIVGTGAITLAGVSTTTNYTKGWCAIGQFPVSAEPRYLTDQDSGPWFGIGDTAWSAIVQLSNADMTTYAEAMAARGINFVLVNLIDKAYGTNAPNNIDNDAPFTGTIFQSGLNEDYWEHADFFIGECLRLGITVLACTNYFGSGTDGFKTELAAASNAQCQTYGEALAQRYWSTRGIILLAGGDDNPDATLVTRQGNVVVGYANANGGNHMWSAHTAPTGTDTAAWSSDHWNAASWLDIEFGYHQGTTITGEGKSHYASGMSTVRPLIYVAEGGYYDDDFGSVIRKDQRRDLFGGPLSGGLAGFLYGDAPRWHFNGYTDGTGTWEDSLLRDGTADLERAATLFDSLQTDTLRPDTSGQLVTAGGSSGATEFAALYDTTHALIYVQTTGSITIDRTEFAAAIRIRRWDPTSGAYTTISASSPNTGTESISHPGNNGAGDADWIYVIDPAAPAATGTPTLARVTMAGTGTVGAAITATGTPTLAAVTLAGTGTQTHAATGTPTLARSTMAGTGTQAQTGSGAPTLAAVALAGTGTHTTNPAATGTPTLAAVTMAGTGTQTHSAAGTPTLARATVAGTGTMAAPVTGTMAVTLARVIMGNVVYPGAGFARTYVRPVAFADPYIKGA